MKFIKNFQSKIKFYNDKKKIENIINEIKKESHKNYSLYQEIKNLDFYFFDKKILLIFEDPTDYNISAYYNSLTKDFIISKTKDFTIYDMVKNLNVERKYHNNDYCSSNYWVRSKAKYSEYNKYDYSIITNPSIDNFNIFDYQKIPFELNKLSPEKELIFLIESCLLKLFNKTYIKNESLCLKQIEDTFISKSLSMKIIESLNKLDLFNYQDIPDFGRYKEDCTLSERGVYLTQVKDLLNEFAININNAEEFNFTIKFKNNSVIRDTKKDIIPETLSNKSMVEIDGIVGIIYCLMNENTYINNLIAGVSIGFFNKKIYIYRTRKNEKMNKKIINVLSPFFSFVDGIEFCYDELPFNIKKMDYIHVFQKRCNDVTDSFIEFEEYYDQIKNAGENFHLQESSSLKLLEEYNFINSKPATDGRRKNYRVYTLNERSEIPRIYQKQSEDFFDFLTNYKEWRDVNLNYKLMEKIYSKFIFKCFKYLNKKNEKIKFYKSNNFFKEKNININIKIMKDGTKILYSSIFEICLFEEIYRNTHILDDEGFFLDLDDDSDFYLDDCLK